jgi:hypothetical protein
LAGEITAGTTEEELVKEGINLFLFVCLIPFLIDEQGWCLRGRIKSDKFAL